MNIGVFGGAFNPVHNGHLHLLDYMSRPSDGVDAVDKILLVPTAVPPHKSSSGLVSGEHRINMLRLAVADQPFSDVVEVSDIEFHFSEKSYTFNTLNVLKELHPDDDFTLFIGSDQLLSFHFWYRYSDILQLATVRAIVRQEQEERVVADYLHSRGEEFSDRVSILPAVPVVVSSTLVRENVRNGISISDLVPPSVEKYIKENGLYV